MREVTGSVAAALPKAAAVFAARGLDGTRMEDIVEATGVPAPNPLLPLLVEGGDPRLAAPTPLCVTCPSSRTNRRPRRARTRPARASHRRLPAAVRRPPRPVRRAAHRTRSHHPHPRPGRRDLGGVPRARAQAPRRGEHDGSLAAADDDMTASAIFGAVTMVGLHHVVIGKPVDPPPWLPRLDHLILHGLTPDTQGRRTDDHRPPALHARRDPHRSRRTRPASNATASSSMAATTPTAATCHPGRRSGCPPSPPGPASSPPLATRAASSNPKPSTGRSCPTPNKRRCCSATAPPGR